MYIFARDPLDLGWSRGPYLEGRISPFLFCPWIWWAGDFWSERERGGEKFQGVHPLEAVAAARDHMLFGLGWVGVGGWGRVNVL